MCKRTVTQLWCSAGVFRYVWSLLGHGCVCVFAMRHSASKMFTSCYWDSTHQQRVWFDTCSSRFELLWYCVSYTWNISVTFSVSWGTQVMSSLGQQPVSSPQRCSTVARGVYMSLEFTLNRSFTGKRRGWGSLHVKVWTFRKCWRFTVASLFLVWCTLATLAITMVSISRFWGNCIAQAAQKKTVS